jgi:branched-chain amino acid transport system permease protein
LALGLALAIPFIVGPFTIFAMTQAFALSLPVLGVAILLRGGLVTFGHALYLSMGAYTGALLTRYADTSEVALVLPLAIMGSAVVALLLGLLLARYRGVFFGMFNLALSMIWFSFLIKFFGFTGGFDGLGIRLPTFFGWSPAPQSARQVMYFFGLAVVVLGFLSVMIYLRSPVGWQMRAIHDNEIRLEYLGLSVSRVVVVTYVLAGALAAAGGVVYGYSVGHVTPELAFWVFSGELVFIALLGGFLNNWGALAGAIVFVFLQSWTLRVAPDWWQMILGLSMFGIIVLLPGGIWSIGERARTLVRR